MATWVHPRAATGQTLLVTPACPEETTTLTPLKAALA